MPSIASCIKKAGKALNRDDADAIKEIQADYMADGMGSSEAATAAIDDYLGIMNDELTSYIDQARAQGADVSSLTGELSYFRDRSTSEDFVDPGPLRYRLEDETSEHIDANRTGPISTLTKEAATVEDQMNYSPSGIQKIKDSIGTQWARTHQLVLKVIPRRYIQDFLGDKAPAVAKYNHEAARMSGRQNELMAEFEPTGKALNKYMGKKDKNGKVLGELMLASTLAGVDPSAEYTSLKERKNMNEADKAVDAKRRGDHRLLSKHFNGLDDTGKQLFNEVRDSYASINKAMFEGLQDRIEKSDADPDAKSALLDKVRLQFESGRVNGPYFPLARFGDYWAAAKDSTSGETISFSKFENKGQWNAWKKEMREAGFEIVQGKKGANNQSAVTEIDPKFVADITKLTGETNPELADDIWQMYLGSLPEMSARKAFIHRKGRMGFSANVTRAFGFRMFHGAHQVARLEHMHRLESHLRDVEEQTREVNNTEGDPDQEWASPVYDELKNRHEWAKNPTGSGIASTMTSLGFVAYLGLTPAAAIVNLSQTAIVGAPVLAARFNMLGTTKHLTKAAMQFAGGRGSIKNKLRGDERQAFEQFERDGLLSKTQAHDLAQISEGMDPSSKMARAMEIASWMFHRAEVLNREVTSMAAYRLSREAGRTHEDAVIEAEELTWDSHFDYSNENRPAIMQNDAAKVMLLFKNYSINMNYRLIRDFRDGVMRNPNISKEARNEAGQRLGGILMSTALLAGIGGLPLMWAIEGMLNVVMDSEDDEPYDARSALRVWLTEKFGGDEDADKMAHAIMDGGVDAFGGVTLSSRVSLNHLFWRELPKNASADEVAASLAMDIIGPLPRLVFDQLKRAELSEEGYGDRAIEKMMPIKAFRDLLKAYRYSQEGLTTKQGAEIIGPDEMDNFDVFFQSIGFQPSVISWQYEKNRELYDQAQTIQDRRAMALGKLSMAIRNGDEKEFVEAMDHIATFNAANPRMMIKPSQAISSVKTRQKRVEEAIRGVNLPKKLRYLHDQMRQVPEESDDE